MRARLVLACWLASAACAHAQPSCTLPRTIESPRLQPPDSPRMLASTDYYALALSWSPQHCAQAGSDPASALQCKLNKFDFVVHGLWPQNEGARGSRGHPRNCRQTLVDAQTVRQTLCVVPGVKLIQGEWQKHGSCAFDSPGAYFEATRRLWSALKQPDVRRLVDERGDRLRAGDIVAGFVQANADAGMRPEHVAVQVSGRRALREVYVCYDMRFRFTPCRTGRAPDDLPLRAAR